MKRTLFILLCLLLASCNLPGQPAASTAQAWLDMPLPDTVFYPPNPCKLIAHGAAPSGIVAFEISINGALASNESPADSKATLATLNIACPTLAPGKNILEVRAQDNTGGWSDSASHLHPHTHPNTDSHCYAIFHFHTLACACQRRER